jgi:hypothetical protein
LLLWATTPETHRYSASQSATATTRVI